MFPAARRFSLAIGLASVALVTACGGGPAARVAIRSGAGFTSTAPATATTTPATIGATTPAPGGTAVASASGPASPGQPPATAGQVPASDPNGASAATALLYPQGPGGVECGGQGSGGYAVCPLTTRLQVRLRRNPVPGARPLCRCQNSWTRRDVTTTPAPWGGVAHVVLTFCDSVPGAATCQPGGYATTILLDVAVLRTATQGWVADDTTCTGSTGSPNPSSIYVPNPPRC